MFELKTCPFCGGFGKLRINYSKTKGLYFAVVRCSNCYAQARGFASHEEPNDATKLCAVNAWNMRKNEL